ncbi:MAG: thiamine pyrophosphate-dependent enzyme [Acidimicrobiales bacterium]
MPADTDQSKRTGGDVVVDALRSQGVDTVFALPGIQLDGLFDAFAKAGDIRIVHTRHEQAAGYMADGYARATGRLGVCVVVPGPGVLNVGAALSTAYATGSQVLCIAGHLFGGDGAIGTGALHEIPNQSSVLEGTIGWTRRVRSVDAVAPAFADALERLHASPHRPAAIEIGPEVLVAPTTTRIDRIATPSTELPTDQAAIENAVAQLADRRRPIIVAGGGAIEAGPELTALAEALGAPIVLTASGKGAVDARADRVLPQVAIYKLLDDCDALIVVGSRFTTTDGPPPVDTGTTVIRIDTNVERLTDWATVNILGDAADSCRALAAGLSEVRPADEQRDQLHLNRVSEIRASIWSGLARRFPDTWSYSQALREAMDSDAILVDEMTQVGYMARHAFPAQLPRTYLGSGYQGTLGFGYPTSLGAKVGRPDRAVVSISGDGGFLFNLGELATAAHHDIAVVAVVFTDNAYGNVKGIQRRTYGREIASTLTNPDLVAVAAGFGIKGWRTTGGPDELVEHLGEAIALDEPALIEVPIGDQPDLISVLYGREPL